MIQSNELRIGNWLSYDGGENGIIPCRIDAQDILNIDTCYMGNEQIHSPIPLTEEILIKCSFAKGETSNEYWTHWILPDKWYISLSHHTEPSAGVIEGNFYYGEQYIEIKYLHDLQNFYFANTRQEINYQP